MPSAAQNRAGLGKWEPGFVDTIGESPLIRAECGTLVRFAYRNVKRMGKPKRIVHVGDRVEFIRPLVAEPGALPKAVHVRLIELPEEPLPPSQFDHTFTLSKSLQPMYMQPMQGWVSPSFPSARSVSDTSDDISSIGGTDSSSASVATSCSQTEWRRHDPYSWEGTWTMTAPPSP